MRTKSCDESSGCIFQWKIKNIRHCWVKKGERIDSPRFIVDALEGTKWFLRLYPSGKTCEKYIGFYLHSENDCVGPDVFKAKYRLAILEEDGYILKEIYGKSKEWIGGSNRGFEKFVEREKVFITQKELFLPKDTLTVHCTIWNTEEKPVEPKHLYAETVFKVNRRCFVWRIDKFSALKSAIKNKIKDCLVEFELVLSQGLYLEKKLDINVNSCDKSIKYFEFKASIIDAKGKKENCGTYEYFANDLKEKIISTLPFIKKLIENKSRYLPNDALSLYCEYVYSDGNVLYEHCGCGVISCPVTDEDVQSRNIHDIGEKETRNPSVLVNDLKVMYNDAIFCDTEIQTLTKNFLVHKAVLSARSPFFRSMFSNDMKEKSSGSVYITDFEADTLHRMILYLYTESLENLQFESATKLYVAADKCHIPSLKSKCCSFLKENLTPTRSCGVLILADKHQDTDLKGFVQDHILENYKDVFGSEEWNYFRKKHGELACDVLNLFALSKI